MADRGVFQDMQVLSQPDQRMPQPHIWCADSPCRNRVHPISDDCYGTTTQWRQPYTWWDFLLFHGWAQRYHLWRVLPDHLNCYDWQRMCYLPANRNTTWTVHWNVRGPSAGVYPQFIGQVSNGSIRYLSDCLYYWIFKVQSPFGVWEVLVIYTL